MIAYIRRHRKLGEKRVYVAGMMRQVAVLNFPAFFAAEGELSRRGWTVINPARVSVDQWTSGDFVPPSDGSPESCRFFARQDLAIITHDLAEELGDMVVVLPGWEGSRGATAEVAVAKWVRLPVLTLEEALR